MVTGVFVQAAEPPATAGPEGAVVSTLQRKLAVRVVPAACTRTVKTCSPGLRPE